MSYIWKKEITVETLFSTIRKIKFNDREKSSIVDLVENAFFYEEKDNQSTKLGGIMSV